MWEHSLLDTVPTTKRHAFTVDTRFEVCPFHENVNTLLETVECSKS